MAAPKQLASSSCCREARLRFGHYQYEQETQSRSLGTTFFESALFKDVSFVVLWSSALEFAMLFAAPPIHPCLQMSESLCGRPLKKVWLVWSEHDKHLVEANLPHDGTYARKSLPNRLLTSFGPDIIKEDLVADPATVQPQKPDTSLCKLHLEFYMTQILLCPLARGILSPCLARGGCT